jgi:ammonia channel protein AmtB
MVEEYGALDFAGGTVVHINAASRPGLGVLSWKKEES